jgi:hypothetical protein
MIGITREVVNEAMIQAESIGNSTGLSDRGYRA